MSSWYAGGKRLLERVSGNGPTVAEQDCQTAEKDQDECQLLHVCTCCMCEVFVKYECCSGAFDTCMHDLICPVFLPFFLCSLDESGAHTYSNATSVIQRPASPASSCASMSVAKLARSLM
jgi:hypothetical protein